VKYQLKVEIFQQIRKKMDEKSILLVGFSTPTSKKKIEYPLVSVFDV